MRRRVEKNPTQPISSTIKLNNYLARNGGRTHVRDRDRRQAWGRNRSEWKSRSVSCRRYHRGVSNMIPRGAALVALTIVFLGNVPASGQTLNMSRDLVRVGIATRNAEPNNPS